VAALTEARAGLVHELRNVDDRFAALEDAARKIVTGCRGRTVPAVGDLCRWCENAIDRDGHRPNCPAGILAALLDGDA
jgi:hypothetical protein